MHFSHALGGTKCDDSFFLFPPLWSATKVLGPATECCGVVCSSKQISQKGLKCLPQSLTLTQQSPHNVDCRERRRMRRPWAQAGPTEVCARPSIGLWLSSCRLMELSWSQVRAHTQRTEVPRSHKVYPHACLRPEQTHRTYTRVHLARKGPGLG